MRKLVNLVINYIIRGDNGGVVTSRFGIDEIIESLPFKVPSNDEVQATVNIIAARYFPGKRIEKIDTMGVMVQQKERPHSGNYFPELEGALKVKVYYTPEDLNGDNSFTVLVYDDGCQDRQGNVFCTWQFIGRDYKVSPTSRKTTEGK